MYHPNAVVSLSPFVAHLWTLVWRSVIHENHLKIIDILRQHTLDAPVERGFYAICRDDDTQFHGHKVTK